MTSRSTAISRNPLNRSRTVVGRVRNGFREFSETSPSRFAILIFASLIVIFTVLFSLPIASADGTVTGLADSLFTAVSVICVTGLATVDMATHWSAFGHVIIFIGVQIGALGVLTLASILGLAVSRRLGCAPASSPPATPTRSGCTTAPWRRARRCASARSATCWPPWPSAPP